MIRPSHRLEQLPPYLFAELERRVSERRRAGVDVISLGIGDPDLPSPDLLVEEARRWIGDASTHRYPSNRGLDAFRRAVADFYRRRFGVELDPDREVLPLLGGKEGVAHVCFAMLDPGELCLDRVPRASADVPACDDRVAHRLCDRGIDTALLILRLVLGVLILWAVGINRWREIRVARSVRRI